LDGRACQSYITRAMKHTTVQPARVHAREIVYWEPIQLAQRLRGQAYLTLFESTMRQEKLGRYSFLACNPSSTLKVENGRTLLDGVVQQEPPLVLLDQILSRNRMPKLAGLPPFQGGLAGYIGYDFGRSLEPHTRLPEFPALCPNLMLHVYDVGIAFDHLQERAWIISTAGEQSEDELEDLLKRKPSLMGSSTIGNWSSNFTRESYEAAVARTIEYILAGDIFQANISQCFSAKIPEGFDALAFYKRLRSSNPATFSAFLDYGDVQIASSSPERLLSFDGTTVEARPIKGTRRRDPNPALDAALVAELASSRKDRAENVMIVDLLRNDLSRVCAPGSVRVPVLCGLESYASVHHLTSVVTGELKPDKSVGDLIAAIFPGGSITGAPKIRAMEVIAEIERQGRGVYCGSIGYFGFNGQVDLNIAIRTAMFAQGVARFQGGGGITARSEPAAEYEETLTKITRIMEAFAP
jgi:para-aminobenzoate synthetase component I